jgi:predicted amidohydrolase
MKIAVVQLNAQSDKEKNIKNAFKLVKQATRNKAKFIVLPEVFNFRGKVSRKELINNVSEKIPGPSTEIFMQWAKENDVCILLGSIYERAVNESKVYNSTVLINNKGKVEAIYRKINLFNAVVGKNKIRESDKFLAGKSKKIGDVFGYKVGLSICYDLRFPEIYKYYAQKGVDVICVPSAFTHQTGKSHWEVLLRARAIEGLNYVLAPNQVGVDNQGIRTYGNSMVIDPWGKILGNAKEASTKIIYSTLDKKIIKKRRSILPGFGK